MKIYQRYLSYLVQVSKQYFIGIKLRQLEL